MGCGFTIHHNLAEYWVQLIEMNKPENQPQLEVEKRHPTAVVLHLFYTDLFDEIRTRLDLLGSDFDLYVSITQDNANFSETILNYYPNAHVLVVENRGRDIAPFIEYLKIILPLEYEILLKFHTKETIHRLDGVSWRKDVFNKLLGSKNQIEIIKTVLSNDLSIGMIGPKDHVLDSRYYMGSNRDQVQSLLYKAGYPQSLPESFSFVASTMFWAKPNLFKPLLGMKIETESFESEPLPVDGCLPHALERFFGLLVAIQGYEIRSISQDGILSAPDPYKIFPFATPPAHLRLRNLKSVVYYRAYNEAYAIEHLRITAPFKAAGIEIIDGVRNGIADPDFAELGDAVIFQREFPKSVLLYDQIVSKARAAGKFVFYEIDDLLFDLPEDHPEKVQELYNDALLPIVTAMVDADLVLVPTKELSQVAESFNPNVLLLPNYLDDALWRLREPGDPTNDRIVRIGYMGSNSHTPDLALIAPAIKRILTKYAGSVQLDVWGTPLPTDLAEVEGADWHPSPTNVYTEFVKFFQTLDFDIAIAPLADNRFNRCKSGLKFLEYSANGIPGVYSRITPYESVITEGVNGLLAGNQDEWYEALSRLIEQPALRKEIATHAQKDIFENWLLSKNIQNWNDIFKKLNDVTYLEDLKKLTRAHVLNVVNRQLYFDKGSAKSYSLKREEVLSARFQELETAHQKDIEKTVIEFEKQIEQKQKDFESYSLKREEEFSARFQELEKQIETSNERISKLLDDNDSLNEQLYYWSGQANQKSAEIVNLQGKLNAADHTLNEIYQSKSWKALTSYRTGLSRIKSASKKMLEIAARIDRVIPGRLVKKKQVIIDSGLFDTGYYLSKNPDVKNADVDPLEHFLNFGGIEGRDPSPEFDSSWYLDNYPDVKAAGINPLLHFIQHGKAEGRASKAVTQRDELQIPALSGEVLIEKVKKPIPDVIFLAPRIKDILEKNLREKYVLSLSHDDYTNVTGGAQVYIADEQRSVNLQDQSYIHVYPYIKGNALVPSNNILYLGVNLDGKHVFETESTELVNALAELNNKTLTKLSIHHCMGFNLSILQAFLDLAGRRGVFWLHDYFSLCTSYNLRRNDQEYCGAPDLNSNACRLCSYGSERKVHTLAFEQLFRENQLEVAAPSQFSYVFWQSRFPVISPYRIIPPATLKWGRNTPGTFTGKQLRIAFLGYPLDYKGWPTWLRLVKALDGSHKYRFFHFSSQQGEPGNYKRIDTRVTKENRLAMVDSLRWNQIDAVVLWSTVAETFSFTLHEALAAGCYIITNPNSGNIQDYIHRNPERGVVLGDESELFDFLDGEGLLNKVKDYQNQGKPQAELLFGSLEEIN